MHEWIKAQFTVRTKSSLKRVTRDKIHSVRCSRFEFYSQQLDERIKETIESPAKNGGRVAHILCAYTFSQ